MIFRKPSYLDTDTLAELASQFEIEVSSETITTTRSLNTDEGNVGAGVDVKVVKGEANSTSGKESELTEVSTRKIRPVAALNKLLDILSDQHVIGDDSISSIETVKKSQVVAFEMEWEISPATEAGNLLRSIINLMINNPEAMNSGSVPPEVLSSVLSTDRSPREKIILVGEPVDGEGPSVVTILDSSLLADGVDEDSFEEELTVFGVVEKVVFEGRTLSLENHLLAGFPRKVRRLIPRESIFGIAEHLSTDSLTEENLTIHGPAIVVKPVAIYP